MNQKKLKELIKKFIQEQLGDVASTGLTSNDGNNVTSPRIGGSYRDDEEEIFNYLIKNKGFGGDGGHYSKDSSGIINYNSLNHQGMFELKKHIKKILEELEEQAYGSATLTTQGPPRSGAIVPTDEYPFTRRPKRTATGMMEQAGQNPKITQNTRNIQDYQKKIQDLTLDNQQIGIDMQKSAMQKSAGDASKGINVAKDKKAKAASKIHQIRKFLKEIASELGQLRQIEIIELTPDQIRKMDELESEQIKWLKDLEKAENELSAANDEEQNLIKQNSKTIGGMSKGIVDANNALRQAKKQMKKQQSQPQSQQMAENYFLLRKNSNLMENMDYHKRKILLENTMKKFFNLFDDGKTDEEVLRIYAEQGVVVPEPFVKKARDQHKKIKQEKLDIGNLEQETKEFKNVSMLDKPEEEVKELSSRLFKEAEIKDRYTIPPEIKVALEDDLKLKPLIRFIQNLKAINSIPPSYRIFLHNGQYFDIVYEDFSLMAKVETKEYYIATMPERRYAIKHINRLLTQPTLKKGDMEDETDMGGLEDLMGGGGGAPKSPSKGPSPSPKPAPPPPPPSPKPKEPEA